MQYAQKEEVLGFQRRKEEALALYGFVVQNGNLLGVVREARERSEELKNA